MRDTFILFPPKTPSKSVTEPIDRHHKEVNPIADYMTAETELPAYLPYPRFLLKMDISHTAKLLYQQSFIIPL